MIRFALFALFAATGCATVGPVHSIDPEPVIPEVCAQSGCLGNADAAQVEACVANGCVSAVQAKPEVIAFQVPLELAHSAPALAGPVGDVPSFTMDCPTTANGTRVAPASGRADYVAIQVWVNSATPVYFGKSGVTSTGWPLCTNTALCPTAYQSYEARNLYCLSSSGTVTINAQVGQP